MARSTFRGETKCNFLLTFNPIWDRRTDGQTAVVRSNHRYWLHRFWYFVVLIIRPHRITTYADAAYCYRPSSVVCLSVTVLSPAKTAEPIELPFGFRARVGSWNPVLDGGPVLPTRSGNSEAGEASHCKI